MITVTCYFSVLSDSVYFFVMSTEKLYKNYSLLFSVDYIIFICAKIWNSEIKTDLRYRI